MQNKKTFLITTLIYLLILALMSFASGSLELLFTGVFFTFFLMIYGFAYGLLYSKSGTIVFYFLCGYLVYGVFGSTLDFSESNFTNDYARITDVDYQAIVVDEPNEEAKIIVTERLTYDIHAASKNNLFWELWRALPESEIDGLKNEYKINYVKQINDNGSYTTYTESPKLYWYDNDYIDTKNGLGPGKWYYSKGPYNEYKRQYECVLFYVDGLYREEVTFEIQYEMTNASFRYLDCSNLYLTFYSEETINHLDSFNAEVLFPLKDMPREGNYYAHSYGTTAYELPFEESTTLNPGYHTFKINLDKSDLKFNSNTEYIEFSFVAYGDDKHIFTEYAPNNIYSSDYALQDIKDEHTEFMAEYEYYKEQKLTVLKISIIVSAIILVYSIAQKGRIRNKYNFYTPSISLDYYREIPKDLDPSFVADLVFCKSTNPKKDDGYSAIILSLVRKGYIELQKVDTHKDWTLKNTKIFIKHKPQKINLNLQAISVISELNSDEESTKELEPLTRTEELYFNLIVKHSYGLEFTMDNFQKRVARDLSGTDTFIKNMENSTAEIGIKEGYFQRPKYDMVKQSLNNKAIVMLILGIFVMLFFSLISFKTVYGLAYGAYFILGGSLILSSLILNKIANESVLLTPKGEEAYQQWRGLYNFLNSSTLMYERTHIELPIWEKYLVYATAFGISKKVIKVLKIRCPEIANSEMLNSSFSSSPRFYSSSRSFRSTSYRTSSSYRSSFSSSSYGGYGGRGGGGGRRRTLIYTSYKT